MSDLINFTELETREIKKLGLTTTLFMCDISEDVYVYKLESGYEIYEPYYYHDTEGDARTGTSSLWVETFEELIEKLKERMN